MYITRKSLANKQKQTFDIKGRMTFNNWELLSFRTDSKLNNTWLKYRSKIIEYLELSKHRNAGIYEIHQFVLNATNDQRKETMKDGKKRFCEHVNTLFDENKVEILDFTNDVEELIFLIRRIEK